jgi:hypothetical protein
MNDETPSQYPNDLDLSSDASEYKVGPGKPPIANRWKKGCKSPNPPGRPRRPKSILPDLKKALNDALHQKVAL